MAHVRSISFPKLGVVVAAFVIGAVVATAIAHPAGPWRRAAVVGSSCGDVVLAGADWLGGAGVDVHSNGDLQGRGDSCANEDRELYDLQADPPTYGFGWQCVELVNRLYAVKGWYPRLSLPPETVGAKWLFSHAERGRYAGLTAHANGSGYTPVPGDMIVHSDGDYGHVAVVDAIDGDTLHSVEQNRSIDGRSQYRYDRATGTVFQANSTITGFIHAAKNPSTGASPAAPAPADPADGAPGALAFSVVGTCTTTEGTLLSESSGFTVGGPYRVTATYPDGSPYPGLSSGVGKLDGSVGWMWPCEGDPPGVYTTTLVDLDTGRSTGPVQFRVGPPQRDAAREPNSEADSEPKKDPVPHPSRTSASTPEDPPAKPTDPPPQRRTITIHNKVTDGGSSMREDTPAYFSTTTRNYCRSAGCAVPGTDMHTGATTTATCQTSGDRATNGEDGNARDDSNPGLYSSTLWYGVTDDSGRTGYLAEVWVSAADRGGLGLPSC